MDSKLSLYLIIATTFSIVSSTTICALETTSSTCNYTVRCQHHAGTVANQNCNSEPYVTFIITDSNVDTLTSAFFGATNFDSRVRAVKTINCSWNTLEVVTWRFYTKCLDMQLSYTNIQNIKKEAFKGLIHLQALNLSHNYIQSLPTNAFKLSDSNNDHSELILLDLSYNKLCNLTEGLLFQMKKLQTLLLNNNKLTTISENLFEPCGYLQTLSIKHNQLTVLNTSLTKLKSLETLDLSFNLLTSLSGLEFRLNSVRFINISHNLIETVDSNAFIQDFKLEILDLSSNKIKSRLETVMFINNNALWYLNLFDNKIQNIQANSFQHTILRYFNIEKNNLIGEIDEFTFNGADNITTINLFNQSINFIKNNSFKNMHFLTSLNFSSNAISFIEPSSFNNSNSITSLDLSFNGLSILTFLKNYLTNLTELFLKYNKLKVIPSNAFQSQEMLIKLDLSNNYIFQIENNSLPLKALQYLYLEGNILNGSIVEHEFSPGKFLRNLDLTNFAITTIENNSFVNLPVVARLNLSHNKIAFIDVNNFKGMDNMYSLDLSHNRLSSIILNNCSLKGLQALYLSNNQLSSLSHSFMNISRLFHFDVTNNFFSDVAELMFDSMPNLKTVYLSDNKINAFNHPTTNSLKSLYYIDLSLNNISFVNLSFFKEIASVNVSFNNLNSFNSSFFDNLHNLQSLDISGNNITQLIPGTFQNVAMLKYLSLADNHLKTLRYGIFRGLYSMEVLDISRNQITELDIDLFHECTEIRNIFIDYNHINSIDVEGLVAAQHKLKILSLGGNPMSCKEIVRNIKNINKTIVREVLVTSIDKIFHEDNVNGIKCGEVALTTAHPDKKEGPRESSSVSVLAIWCSILTIVLIATGVVGFFYFKNKLVSLRYELNTPFNISKRSSLELNSECRNDLLS